MWAFNALILLAVWREDDNHNIEEHHQRRKEGRNEGGCDKGTTFTLNSVFWLAFRLGLPNILAIMTLFYLHFVQWLVCHYESIVVI